MKSFQEITNITRSIFMIFVYLGVGIFLCMASSLKIDVSFPGGKWNYIVGILAILYSLLRIYQVYTQFKLSKNRNYE